MQFWNAVTNSSFNVIRLWNDADEPQIHNFMSLTGRPNGLGKITDHQARIAITINGRYYLIYRFVHNICMHVLMPDNDCRSPRTE